MSTNGDVAGNGSVFQELLKNPWSKLLGALAVITTVFTTGFKVGNFNRDVDCRMEKIEMKQQYNEQIQKSADECRELKISQYSKSVSELEMVIKEFKKDKSEK